MVHPYLAFSVILQSAIQVSHLRPYRINQLLWRNHHLFLFLLPLPPSSLILRPLRSLGDTCNDHSRALFNRVLGCLVFLGNDAALLTPAR